MKNQQVSSRILACSLLASLALLGCGSVDPQAGTPGAGGDSGGGGAATGPLLPWAEGNRWTYRVTKDGVVTEKETSIGPLEEVSGTGPYAETMAFHVTTAKGAQGQDHTESWQAADPDNAERIVRYREESYGATTGELELDEYWDPPKLHIDGSVERSVKGASWLEIYQETKREVGLPETSHEVRERWTVVDDDETLEVPAGTFEHVIHFQKVGSGATKNYWYLRGVGKLKETGSQTEELVDYSVEVPTP